MIKYFSAKDGRRLAYEDTEGDGPVVLCLAGLTRNHRDFEDLARHLSPRYRVLRLDSRGRGASDHALDPMTEYAVPTEAGDALALMDHLSLSRLALIGTSRGGILSMAIAGAQSERISAVVLNDVGAVIEGRGLLRILATLGRPLEDETFTAAAARLRNANADAFPNVPDAEWLRHAHRLYDDADGRPVLSYDPKLQLAVGGAIEEDGPEISIWPLFDALKTLPVLVIRGENSDILHAETVDAMRAEHPDLQTLTLADRGHTPFLNEPEALSAIDAFLGATSVQPSSEKAADVAHSAVAAQARSAATAVGAAPIDQHAPKAPTTPLDASELPPPRRASRSALLVLAGALLLVIATFVLSRLV